MTYAIGQIDFSDLINFDYFVCFFVVIDLKSLGLTEVWHLSASFIIDGLN